MTARQQKNYLLELRVLTLWALTLNLFSLAACTKVTVPESLGTLQFSGISAVDVTNSGAVIISWEPARIERADSQASDISYKIYASEVAQSELSSLKLSSVNVADAVKVASSPRSSGKLLSTVTTTSYDAEKDLESGKSWAFEVVAVSGDQSSSGDIVYAMSYAAQSKSTVSSSYSLEVVAGNFQSAYINAPFSQPLVVKLTDTAGSAMSGESISFQVATDAGILAPKSATTDAEGKASTNFTAGGAPGTYQVTATWTSASGTAVTQSFTETVAAIPDQKIFEIVSGNFQSGAISAAAASSLVVRAKNGETLLAGENITFAISQSPSGATGQTLVSTSLTTDSNGTASTQFSAGNKEGAYLLTATWGSKSVAFVYYASNSSALQDQIDALTDPNVGSSGATPPVAHAVGVPSQPSSATSLNIGVQDVNEYRYVVVDSSISCVAAAGGYNASWIAISTPISLSGLSNGEKRLCLLGKNGIYVQSTATSYTWIVDSSAPSNFAIIAPNNITNDGTPDVSWQASTGAVSYDLKVASDAACTTIVQSYNAVVGTSKTLLSLGNGTYYVCVRATNAAGTTSDATNDGYSFLVDTAIPNTPAAPAIPGAYVASTSVTLTWSAVTDNGPAGLSGYNLRVGTVAGGSSIYSGDVGNITTRTLVSLVDGTTYYAELQAVDAAGNVSPWSATSSPVTIDTAVNTAPTTITTAADANNGPDVRYDDDTTFYVIWSGAADSGSGIKDYTLIRYDQAACAGSATLVSGITATNYAVTGVNGTTYSFKVSAFDNVGNVATSTCSANMTVDTTPPPALSSFSGAAGALSGETRLTLGFPGSTADYSSIVIRRAAGASAPADCTAGSVVRTISSFVTTQYTDQTLSAGNYFSYRACIYDFAGNLTSSNTALNIQAKQFTHTIFTTSTAYPGNLGGYVGADEKCTTLATAAGLAADHWKAILSWGYNNAADRVTIKGPIYKVNAVQVATGSIDLWDGTIASAVDRDENNIAFSTIIGAWSGSSTGGQHNGYSCSNWTSTAWSNQRAALPSNTTSNWIDWNWTGACSGSLRIMCLSQIGPAFTAVTGTTNIGDVNLSLTYPADTSSYGSVVIRRLVGTTAPSSDCTTTGTTAATITSFNNQTFADATGVTSGFVSYRACLYDVSNNLIMTTPISAVQVLGQSHTIFATQTTYNGNLGGINGADDKCAAAAAAGGLTGDHWRALLSANYNSASSRLTINGPVYRSDGYYVAQNGTDLWDGSIISNLSVNEYGNAITVTQSAWTGSTSVGVNNGYTCSNWTSTAWTNQDLGHLGLTDYQWLAWNGNQSCSWGNRLLCISQMGPRFTVATGTGNAGDITYSLTFPAVTTGYGKVEVRRLAGTTAPNADCSSDGTLIANITNFTSNSWTDATGVASAMYSYRACLYDSSNVLIQTYPMSGVRAMGPIHTVFVTSTTHNANFGGIEGMDAYCTNAATVAGLTGDHYRAIASDQYNAARDHLDIRAPIYRTDNYLIASSASDLWDGTIGASISVDETGTPLVSTGGVWTDTSSGGTRAGNGWCGDWRSTLWTSRYAGNSGLSDSQWASWNGSQNCSSALRLYCLSQTGPLFKAETGTVTTGDIKLTLTFPADTSGMGHVTIRRLSGATAPNADCTSDGTQIFDVTSLTTQTLTDATGVNSGFYSYRACTYDTNANLIGTFQFANVRAKGYTQTAFVTSGVYPGNFGGLAAADSICSTAATNAGLVADAWKAILSDSTTDARNRFSIKGPIYRLDTNLVAKDFADFWDGNIASLQVTETGALYATSSFAWTATSSSGVYNGQICNDWTSTAPTGRWTGNVTAGDGNWTYSNTSQSCSSSLHLYCISQIGNAAPLTAFSGATGATNNGDIDLTIDFPATTTGWGRLDLRRLEGKAAPNADCNSNGTVVASLTSFSDTTTTDAAPYPGRIYSYRACGYDTDGALIGSLTTSAIKAKGTKHTLFMTLSAYTGNLGGLSGADTYCQNAATAAGLSGTYVAVLSTSTVSSRNRFVADNDPIYDTANNLIATNENDMFDSTLQNVINYDEYGNIGPGANTWTFWSGSSTSGTSYSGSCTDWTVTTGSATYGRNGYTDFNWSTQNTNYSCASSGHLICISQ